MHAPTANEMGGGDHPATHRGSNVILPVQSDYCDMPSSPLIRPMNLPSAV
jgi:hypothetical protein